MWNMESMNDEQAFWRFGDQLRFQSCGSSNLALNNSIWNNSHAPKKVQDRRNFDFRSGTGINTAKSGSATDWNGFKDVTKLGHVGAELRGSDLKRYNWSGFNPISDWNSFDACEIGPVGAELKNSKPKVSDLNVYGDIWKLGCGRDNIWNDPLGSIRRPYGGLKNNTNLNAAFGNCLNPADKHTKNTMGADECGVKSLKKSSKNSASGSEDGMDSAKSAADKRFKTLPPTEALPRSETIGGYIFVCNNDTMQENLRRQLFGLPPRYRDSVRAITPGLPLFLYNYTTHQLHGIYEAASFGGTNIDPTAWEDKKCHGESRFPAQVKINTRRVCEPLEEDSFRPILHHYDGPKFRLELNVPEAISLLDIFDNHDSKVPAP